MSRIEPSMDRFEAFKIRDPLRGGIAWEIRDNITGIPVVGGMYPDSLKIEAIQHARRLIGW